LKAAARVDQLSAFGGATGWFNSEPLGPAELHGKVVLVHFWTFTCINWLRTEPYVRGWSRAYRDDGLVVIGVHTPEFSFEHEIDRVGTAVRAMDIDYPVAVDSDYAVWAAFDNHYWPALYLLDRDGIIRDEHFGGGRYAQSERTLQQLLGIEREPISIEGIGVEAQADWDNLHSPETYLGYARGERRVAERPSLNEWALEGRWEAEPERVVLTEAGGSITDRFHARDAHLVLARGVGKPIPFRLLLDGEGPGQSHGLDVDEHGVGLLEDGRLYQLVRQQGEVRDRTLEVAFGEPGAEAYVFTFG
jgi:thiol-disulfide isomerase/thioredoxin